MWTGVMPSCLPKAIANNQAIAAALLISNDAATAADAAAGAENTIALAIADAQSLVRGTAELCIHLAN